MVVVQYKFSEGIDSLTICPLTSRSEIDSQSRVPIRPDGENGLRHLSHIIVEKISMVKTRKLGRCLDVLTPRDLGELE